MIATNNIAYCCFNFAISATTTAATTKKTTTTTKDGNVVVKLMPIPHRKAPYVAAVGVNAA